MPPKALELETPVAPDPNAPPVTELAGGSPPPAKAGAKAKAPPDTAGVDQFLKAQLGSDRYKEVMPGAGAAADGGKPEGDGKPPERGPDGKFLKPGAKPAPKAGEKKPEA